MHLVMCRSCGHFVEAVKEEGQLVPMADECVRCGGTTFKDNGSGRTIETGTGTDTATDDDD
jgi:hypothetical protein